MTEFISISQLPPDEALRVWNHCFTGYYADVSLSLSAFIARATQEDLDLEQSFVMLEDGEAAGILMIGIRKKADRTHVWNGGTAIAPEFRGQGKGKQLLEESLRRYAVLGADEATLEALAQNEAAIGLYKRYGYEVADTITTYTNQAETPVATDATAPGMNLDDRDAPEAALLKLYAGRRPWQTQWESVKGGRLLTVRETGNADNPAAWVLYRRVYGAAGELTGVTLYGIGCAAGSGEPEEALVKRLLAHIFGGLPAEVKKTAMHVSSADRIVVEALGEAGFTPAYGGVLMHKTL